MTRESKNWTLLLLLAIVWGSSFILMKRGMSTLSGEPIFSDSQVAALRMLIAGLVLLPFGLRAITKIQNRKELLCLTIVGSCGNFLPAYLFTFAETEVSSGYAGMLNSFTPIFTMIIGFFIFKNRLSWVQGFGLIVGTVGIVLLVLAGNTGGEDLTMTGSGWHVSAIVVATFLYAVSLNTIKYTLQRFKAIDITALAFLLVLLPALFSMLQQGTVHTIRTNSHALEGLSYITLLGVIGTALAVILFNQLIASSSTLFASSVTYFIPIVALFIGLSIGEKINLFQIGAMFIVLTGVFIANYWRGNNKKETRSMAPTKN
jgi:drug/metabolite transporter (DMT)-like permease